MRADEFLIHRLYCTASPGDVSVGRKGVILLGRLKGG